jgi:hypothetical protein
MLTIVLVLAGWVSLYIVVRMMVARSCARLRDDFQKQIGCLAGRIEASGTTAAQPSSSVQVIGRESASIIAAAAAGLAAKRIQVRPVKPTVTHPAGDSWAQLGREGVHSSHDIAQRGH